MAATKVSPYVITDQMIDDIVTTALEGGINYWAISASVPNKYLDLPSKMFPNETAFASETLTMGATMTITINPMLDDRTYLLTKDRVVRGIRKEAERENKTPLALYEDHDASTADCIIQWALFGELIYG